MSNPLHIDNQVNTGIHPSDSNLYHDNGHYFYKWILKRKMLNKGPKHVLRLIVPLSDWKVIKRHFLTVGLNDANASSDGMIKYL